MKADAGIPSDRCRKRIIPRDTSAYQHRNRIECCVSKHNHSRRVETRHNRRTIHFAGFVHLVAARSG
jgi:hypothetical protein